MSLIFCQKTALCNNFPIGVYQNIIIHFFKALFCFCFLKDLLFFHQCTYNIITERTYKIKQLYKIINRTQSKQFITRKGSYILSYRFQREDSKNLIVFFHLDMIISLIKYCFQLCKPSNFLFQNVSVCLYLTSENSNQASLFWISYC